MNEIIKHNSELDNIADEIQGDTGFQKMLKFKKGDYFCDGQQVDLGTQMLAHCIGFTKVWIKFKNGALVEKKIYRVARGERAPAREQLDDLDESQWSIGLNNLPADPWVLQYLLPMEDPETEDVRIFVAPSYGGKRAVSDLCDQYVRRVRRHPESGQPMIRLQKTMMPTKKFGNVPRPLFEVVGWTEGGIREPIRDISEKAISEAEMNDEIPF